MPMGHGSETVGIAAFLKESTAEHMVWTHDDCAQGSSIGRLCQLLQHVID